MDSPVDLLLITHNRLHYLRKTLTHLLKDPSEFHIHWWDNASDPELVDWVESLNEPRIVRTHQASENVGQLEPTRWFLQHAKGDVAGKIDDDVLLPAGWTEPLAEIVRSEARAGLMACWIFMPEDYRERWARRRVIRLGPYEVLRNVRVQGQSFLARVDLLRHYATSITDGLPVDQIRMTSDGLVNGFPMPILFGHNMDDPRSEHCAPVSTDADSPSGLTARNLRFQTSERYAEWIAADARERQLLPFFIQRTLTHIEQMDGISGRLLRRISSRLVPSNRLTSDNFRRLS